MMRRFSISGEAQVRRKAGGAEPPRGRRRLLVARRASAPQTAIIDQVLDGRKAPASQPAPRGDNQQAECMSGATTAELIETFDWSETPLGPLETWPQSLKTITSFLVGSPVPIVLLWGPDGVMIYNDAYSLFAEARHPQLLGSKVREGWPEVADFNDNVMKVGLAGGTLAYRDRELILSRSGRPESVWMNLDYSPVLDESGTPAGVIAIVVETTERVLAERRQAAATIRQRQQFQQAPGFIIVMTGPEHRIEFVNDTHRRTFGSDDWPGRTIREAFPSIAGQGFYELLDRVYATGQAYEAAGAEVRYRRAPGHAEEVRRLSFVYAPIFDEDSTVTGVFCDGFDVTEAHAAQAALQDREEQLRLATEAAEIGLWDVDVLTDTLFWPPRVKAMFGISSDVAVSLDDFYAGLHPDDRVPVSAAFAAACDPQVRAVYDVEYRAVGKEDAVVRWVEAKGRGVFDDQGRCVRVIGTAVDISVRKAVDEHLRLMVNELNHRVKNSLATVQGIVTQTLRRGQVPDSVREALTGRLIALARAHDVLTEGLWSGADLRGIAEQAAAPYSALGVSPFHIEGPSQVLPPKSAIAMSLAFHELATNAAKYGALSVAGGRVVVSWRHAPSAEGVRLHLTWRESGGPPVSPPAESGFGSRLIERGLAADLAGPVHLAYLPTGVVCTIEMNLELDRPASELAF